MKIDKHIPASVKAKWKIPYLTVSGHEFDLWNITPFNLCVFDLAHGCAKECRFGNQILDHYSVAEHQILAASLVQDEYVVPTLVHDAAEGLGLRDMPGPIKHWDGMIGYRQLEDRVQSAVWAAFGVQLTDEIYQHVKVADKLMYSVENKVLRGRETKPVVFGHDSPVVELQCWDVKTARKKYIEALAAPYLKRCEDAGVEPELPRVFGPRSRRILGLDPNRVGPMP